MTTDRFDLEAGRRIDDAAALLKALGHPLRLRLTCGLCCEPRSLSRIAGEFRIPLSTVALHLGVLRRAGVLGEERRGAEIRFRVNDPRVRRLLRQLCGAGEAHPTDWNWTGLAAGIRTAHGSARDG